MSDTADKAKHGIKEAEQGVQGGAEEIDEVREADPATADAVEQEAKDGPPGRGVSR